MRATYSKLRGVDCDWTYCYDCELCNTVDCWKRFEHACDGCHFGELSVDVIQEMKMKNSYKFKSWHNGAGEWFVFTVEAAAIDEAYDEAYKVVHNTLGLEPEVELCEATCPQEWEIVAEVIGDKPTTLTIQHLSENGAMIAAEIWLSEHCVDYEDVYITHLKEVK